MMNFLCLASRRRSILCLLLALISTSATGAITASPASVIDSNPLNDLVRILAGLPVAKQSPYADLMRSPAWQSYHEQIQHIWARYDQSQAAKVEAFRAQWLPKDVHQNHDLLYPFAGADFLYADLFFPQATNIYMFGLEPLGEIPGRERLNSAYYNGVIQATEDLLRLTFFRTKAMRQDFLRNGTVPLLSYFIVHRGHVIKDITYLRLDDQGIPHSTPVAKATGARIAFQDAHSARIRALWYWRGDLSNQALANAPGLQRYLSDLPRSNLYMKAASYLCHHQGFQDACTLFRDRARLSLQEDSGMPLRFFPAEDWTRTFFGKYSPPISVFTDPLYRQQNALRQAYANANQVHALPFPLGYHASAHADNLMLAIRTDAAPVQPSTPEPELEPEPTAATPTLAMQPSVPPSQPSAQSLQPQTIPEPAASEPTSPVPPTLPPPAPKPPQATESAPLDRSPAPTSKPAPAPAPQPEPEQEQKQEKKPQPTHQPASIQEQLDAAGIAYKINDGGTIWLIQSVNNGRTQLTFIATAANPIGEITMRDIWSVGYLSTDDALSVETTMQLLKDNAANHLGAWELGSFVGKAAGIFRARIPAETDWQTLATIIKQVSTTADSKERELMGGDEL
ncbi:hypothetical protein [Rhabdochromatium marinum]|uniref:hypothetical protein n=1 Tax=Rhabdochromatium marinum TaxID=48729 RepID=UPI001908BB84|nr:hypothetical protein [Rhabdochromatium marinum]MBK1647569.1 hypothetical protein [Rhabdochromatium marinum]